MLNEQKLIIFWNLTEFKQKCHHTEREKQKNLMETHEAKTDRYTTPERQFKMRCVSRFIKFIYFIIAFLQDI